MITKLYGFLKAVLLFPFKFLSHLFGHFSWSAPAWMHAINNKRREHTKLFWGACVLILASGAGYFYYESLPKPITVKAVINEVRITSNYENASPNNLSIRFEYDYSKLKKDQKRPSGYPSVARIDLVGEEIKSGISLSPKKKGTWTWTDDRRIEFVPEIDWPAGIEYKVTFSKEMFVAEAKLSEDTYEFSTPEFSVDIRSIELYQDPQDISVRRVISTIRFSHPVDKDSLEEKIALSMRPSGSTITVGSKPYSFDITYDKNLREAYIQSEPVQLPSQPNYMKLEIAKNVKTIFRRRGI